MPYAGSPPTPRLDLLPLLVKPRSDETLASFLIALACRNKYRNVSILLEANNIWWAKDSLEKTIHDVARISGQPIQTILDMSNIPRSDGRVVVGEMRLAARNLENSKIYVCPDCWDNERIIRRYFEFSGVAACSTHGLELVHRCRCFAYISPNSLVRGRCPKCALPYKGTLRHKYADQSLVRFAHALQCMIREGVHTLHSEHPMLISRRGRKHKAVASKLWQYLVRVDKAIHGTGHISVARWWAALVRLDWREDGTPNPYSKIPIEQRIPRHWVWPG